MADRHSLFKLSTEISANFESIIDENRYRLKNVGGSGGEFPIVRIPKMPLYRACLIEATHKYLTKPRRNRLNQYCLL